MSTSVVRNRHLHYNKGALTNRPTTLGHKRCREIPHFCRSFNFLFMEAKTDMTKIRMFAYETKQIESSMKTEFSRKYKNKM